LRPVATPSIEFLLESLPPEAAAKRRVLQCVAFKGSVSASGRPWPARSRESRQRLGNVDITLAFTGEQNNSSSFG
jgi:hypothetical protein